MWPFSKVERLQRVKADYLWFDKNWNYFFSAEITLNCSTIMLINITCLIILHTIYPQHVAINFDYVRIFFLEKCVSKRHIKNHPGKYQEMNFHQDTYFSFQVCAFCRFALRDNFASLQASIQSSVFFVRDDEENIALAQAWDKCNFSIRWHFASGGIPMQCLYRLSMLEDKTKKIYF